MDEYDEAFAEIERKQEIMKQVQEAFEAAEKREWVGLTELEKAEITSLKWWDWEDTFDIDGFIKAIEAKLKEKNT
jgi:hypothetical protein